MLSQCNIYLINTLYTLNLCNMSIISHKAGGRKGKRISGRIKQWLPPGKKEVETQWKEDGVEGDTVYLILFNIRTMGRLYLF